MLTSLVRFAALVAVVLSLASPARAGMVSSAGLGPDSAGFAFFATPTAWDPGPNAARIGNHPAPGSATFSIMGAGHLDVGGFDTSHGAGVLSQDITALAVPGFAFNDYVSVIDWALDTWDAASGFTNLGFVPDSDAQAGALESDGGHIGDIRVGAWEISNTTQLAHTFQPGTESVFGGGGTVAGDLHLDINRIWADDPTDTTLDPDYDIYSAILHEMGHALGLQHSSVPGATMNAAYQGVRRQLAADDIAGIQALYSVPEPTGIALALAAAVAIGLAALRRRRLHVIGMATYGTQRIRT